MARIIIADTVAGTVILGVSRDFSPANDGFGRLQPPAQQPIHNAFDVDHDDYVVQLTLSTVCR